LSGNELPETVELDLWNLIISTTIVSTL